MLTIWDTWSTKVAAQDRLRRPNERTAAAASAALLCPKQGFCRGGESRLNGLMPVQRINAGAILDFFSIIIIILITYMKINIIIFFMYVCVSERFFVRVCILNGKSWPFMRITSVWNELIRGEDRAFSCHGWANEWHEINRKYTKTCMLWNSSCFSLITILHPELHMSTDGSLSYRDRYLLYQHINWFHQRNLTVTCGNRTAPFSEFDSSANLPEHVSVHLISKVRPRQNYRRSKDHISAADVEWLLFCFSRVVIIPSFVHFIAFALRLILYVYSYF